MKKILIIIQIYILIIEKKTLLVERTKVFSLWVFRYTDKPNTIKYFAFTFSYFFLCVHLLFFTAIFCTYLMKVRLKRKAHEYYGECV